MHFSDAYIELKLSIKTTQLFLYIYIIYPPPSISSTLIQLNILCHVFLKVIHRGIHENFHASSTQRFQYSEILLYYWNINYKTHKFVHITSVSITH